MRINLFTIAMCGFLTPTQQKSKKVDPPLPVRSNIPVDAAGKFVLPENLSDANQDGKVDEGDFIRGFANLEMTTWEIKQIFSMADFKKEGHIDINQWRLFREMFVKKFMAADVDANLLVDLAELNTSMADIGAMTKILLDTEMITQLLNDVSGRIDKVAGSVNFFEWMFIRQCAVAWSIASGRQDTITKDELLDIGMKVMPHFNAYEGQLKNVLFSAINFKQYNVHYSFLDCVNMFHKFLIFESMRKHNSVSGTLNYLQMVRAIDDHIGPAELFTVEGQEQMFNLNQAFYLRDDEEEIGIDFPNFYYLMKAIYAVKEYGKTTYGSLTAAEFTTMTTTHPHFKTSMITYMKNSHVMVGDYKKIYDTSSESEAYVLSSGQTHPANWRFKGVNPKLRKAHKMKLAKAPDAQKGDDIPAANQTVGPLEFTIAGDASSCFYTMYSSHVYLAQPTWGDINRLFKYFRLFQEWDDRKGARLFLVYPNQLTELDLQHYEGVFYAKEKDLIQNMVISFRENKEADRVTYDLPIDYLTFTRYFAYQGLVQVLAKQNEGELVSYRALLFVFQKMGLISYNNDVAQFMKLLNQGMNSFTAEENPDTEVTNELKMVNGFQAFMLAQIRSARQLAAKYYFNDDENYITPIPYQLLHKRRRARKA